MSSILTNNSAMVALETLRGINKSLTSVQNEISTGKTVATAKDNAAIWAITTVMSTDVQSFNQITDSLNKGSSVVGTARSAAEQVTTLLQEMKELIVSAQEDLSADDRAKIQTEIDGKRTTIGNIVNAAQFNGVNLLKGTDDMSVLASLDRAADGTVTATKITVARNDLTTTGAVDAADKEDGDAGYVSTEDTLTPSDVDKEDGDAGFITASQAGDLADTETLTLTFAAGDIAEGDVFAFTLGGSDFSYTAEAGDTINDVVAALRSDIDDASIANLGAAGGADADDPSADDATITVTASGAVTWDSDTIETTFEQEQIADTESVDVTVAGGTIAEGDTFTINVGGEEYEYTAEDGDTNNDVAAGLKALIDADEIENLVVTVTDADDPTSDAATINLAADGGAVVISLSGLGSQDAATDAGGLGALEDLSVETEADAATALSTIEDLMDTAITAAASFGSSQKQIEGQATFVQTLIDSMTSGIGAMVDADMEAASAKLQALQVQQQLGVQALSIANSSPQTLLALFQ